MKKCIKAVGLWMLTLWAYLAAQTVKESACDTGDPWVRKIPLEKGIATHSSILAWRVPWTEEHGRLQSVRLQKINMTEQLTHTHTHTVDREEISRESCSLFGNKATQ